MGIRTLTRDAAVRVTKLLIDIRESDLLPPINTLIGLRNFIAKKLMVQKTETASLFYARKFHKVI